MLLFDSASWPPKRTHLSKQFSMALYANTDLQNMKRQNKVHQLLFYIVHFTISVCLWESTWCKAGAIDSKFKWTWQTHGATGYNGQVKPLWTEVVYQMLGDTERGHCVQAVFGSLPTTLVRDLFGIDSIYHKPARSIKIVMGIIFSGATSEMAFSLVTLQIRNSFSSMPFNDVRRRELWRWAFNISQLRISALNHIAPISTVTRDSTDSVLF